MNEVEVWTLGRGATAQRRHRFGGGRKVSEHIVIALNLVEEKVGGCNP
jgi:hypothetical protein